MQQHQSPQKRTQHVAGAGGDDAAFGLYLVMTDPVAGYARCAEAAVAEGVRYVQLRIKDAPRAEILATARTVKSITAGSRTLFIVNDDPAIAAEAGADGVHLGQSDMPPGEVRRLYPALRVAGISTHDIAQARAAAAHEPAYIGVGPVFPTPTKAVPDPALGVEEAVRIIRSVAIPAVAIGGIDTKTLPVILAAGAGNYAVVRAVCSMPDPRGAIRRLQDIWREIQHG